MNADLHLFMILYKFPIIKGYKSTSKAYLLSLIKSLLKNSFAFFIEVLCVVGLTKKTSV